MFSISTKHVNQQRISCQNLAAVKKLWICLVYFQLYLNSRNLAFTTSYYLVAVCVFFPRYILEKFVSLFFSGVYVSSFEEKKILKSQFLAPFHNVSVFPIPILKTFFRHGLESKYPTKISHVFQTILAPYVNLLKYFMHKFFLI